MISQNQMEAGPVMKTQELDNKQIESEGRVGYTAEKVAPLSTIHPSKRPRKSMQAPTSPADLQEFSSCSAQFIPKFSYFFRYSSYAVCATFCFCIQPQKPTNNVFI